LQATSLKQKANEEIKRGSRCRLHKHTPYGPAVQSLEHSHFTGREKVGPLLPLLEGVAAGVQDHQESLHVARNAVAGRYLNQEMEDSTWNSRN